ncbi:hypothetical protein D3C85_1698350 [compost metagenome]
MLELLQPRLVLGKAQWHLHLVAVGHPTVKTPAVIQNGVHLPLVFRRRRQWQLARHHVVRQVGQQLEVGQLL